ncbi:glycyl-tRNA synthetase beta chain [Panacagrimonas perspica]|uniref:Glycine--tRNA ligase beta subunit n=1 Tax=Panacagrimonas perspica TaxID=381431 RepID=A0A4V6RR45_9GAMM|nr:glycine--tRNA ligase subunit beta [Panacagrimonas perspica]TDU28719.1 glycyl-tRNA synthetase beta chain [Panacagrimonas perspica]THD05041.1 glycine--tRNA ligase subunit beta [Panacagrimonas perspica]
MTLPLLLEIGCEDLPARYVVPLANALGRGIAEGLAKRGVSVGTSSVFATPRRIAVQLSDVAQSQPDQTAEMVGPALAAALKDGQPTPAALGFARKCGVEFSALGQKDGKLYFARNTPGRPTRELIPEIFQDTLRQMDELVPKRMRWGAGDATFVRPVEWLCCLLGTESIPLRAFGLDASRLTYGHRFHAPDPLPLTSAAHYADALRTARVWADVALRKAEIRSQIETAAAKLGGHARITEDLLDEVTALVELPVAIAGRFEERFLELPPEVIVATVETNQRYFTVFSDTALTRLTNHFITISNIESRDESQVIAGNERVVRPRLTDALFFYQQDLKHPLVDYAAKLDAVTFQKDLGSIGAKVERMAALARGIAATIAADGQPVGQVASVSRDDLRFEEWAVRAARLCKGDLVTKVVYEFPELQGLMGGYYASKSGEHPEVAVAIREHYLPTQQGTPIPSTRAGQYVALADKLDTLAGIFAIGQKPSASKDPFALRRAALGVLRICLEGGLPLDLRQQLAEAVDLQPAGKRDATVVAELFEFVMERLRAWLVGQEHEGRPIAIETFESVKALGIHYPLDVQRRVLAVHGFVALEAAPNLAAANKRIRNILKQAGAVEASVDPAKFEHAAEGALFEAMKAQAALNAQATSYTQKLVNLASLRAPVDAFFERVMVNAEDPAVRANRLALLKQLDAMCRDVADLSCLPG